MEPIRCSETLDANYKTPGKYPKENSSSIQHGESLKSRIIYFDKLYNSVSGVLVSGILPTLTYLLVTWSVYKTFYFAVIPKLGL